MAHTKLVFYTFITLAIFLTSSCATKSEVLAPKKTEESMKTVPALKNCICIKMYMPVCGSDNITYGNACEADCKGVSFTQGACGFHKE